jgi:hypothetical protein
VSVVRDHDLSGGHSVDIIPQEQANSDWLNDARLSWGARGIMWHIEDSNLDEVVIARLIAVPSAGRAGRDAIRSYVQELIDCGYLRVEDDGTESLRMMKDRWRLLREFIFDRDGFACRYCGDTQGPFQLDHVVPIAKGGNNEPANLITACAACNRSKQTKALEDWRPVSGVTVSGLPGSGRSATSKD